LRALNSTYFNFWVQIKQIKLDLNVYFHKSNRCKPNNSGQSPFQEILICVHILCGPRGLLYFWQPSSRKGAISPFLQPLCAHEITTVSDWSLTQPPSLTQTIHITVQFQMIHHPYMTVTHLMKISFCHLARACNRL
jgi:hypothetical protein